VPDDRRPPPAGPPVFTVGHSNHSLERLIELLAGHGVGRIVDVRRFPGSRRLPHFGRETLATALPERGLDYRHLAELGGRRPPRPDSPNAGWRVLAFRAYADHMSTPDFRAALAELERLAAERPTALMCAEGLWWRCHRRLIADALVVRGWTVRHIAPDGRGADHDLTAFALARGGELTYPPQTPELAADG
jgi:uncharacterized protein (DUF488 family)